MTNSGRKLDRLTIRGFKSIELLEDLELGSLNILIGANGAGKSNFVEFFRLLGEMVQQRLQAYVKQNGPADGYFFNGVRHTKKIEAHFKFGKNGYKFTLEPTAEGGIIIGTEGCEFYGDIVKNHSPYMASGNSESVLKDHRSNSEPATYVWNSVSNWRVYHFHDTSMTAGMRRDGGVEQSDRLAPNGENLAAFIDRNSLFQYRGRAPDKSTARRRFRAFNVTQRS